ncbi:lytic transglycosylase domain-containing protein [Caballeronia sp. LP003]|uniref:lytic transglycosylase domain-containing protein n=1 Tax=Caballeronia sp. LP003 TaxID=3038551 RepID=UPI002859F02A|nr:lytic transglycosylase domain-containing protein [Caballeronia sp. LP003]MDR5791706.1 lytic transglycosylase domain-containing protein [Caballeronia sp. LP003]
MALSIGIVALLASTSARADDKMLSLLAECAPNVHWSTMSAIVKVESSGKAYALADAGPLNVPYEQRKNMVRSYFPSSLDDAAQLARDLISNGHTVSLGLAQVNDRNLSHYGLTIEQALDPCTNLATGAKILSRFYQKASKQFGEGQQALEAAISAYNSGSFERGISNGYVGQVYRAAGYVPALTTAPAVSDPAKPIKVAFKSPRRNGANLSGSTLSREAMLRAGAESALTDSSQPTEN